jgi:SAM-dependent methyltransferase
MSATTPDGPTALPTTLARPVSILDSYCRTAPSDQNAVDIFQGEWSSQFPPPFDHLKAGPIALFQDVRVSWAIDALGGIGGQTVLELGPLEGGHAYMLEHAGASFITAIEANSRAYLKCLITKEILQLERTRFWCGNFIPFMESTTEKFDLIIAAGVLYHMPDPVKLLELIARCTGRVYLWTHYYDAGIITANPNLNSRFQGTTKTKVGDTEVIMHHQFYKAGLKEKSYCGGTDVSSKWLTRDGILHTLKHHGFTEFEFSFETPDHPNGPCMAMVAIKR